MSVFCDTFVSCQQLSLLSLDTESATAQAERDFADATAFLQEQAQAMRDEGHKVELIEDASTTPATSASLRWKLPGRRAHPRDTYVLALAAAGDVTTARFIGPQRSATVLLLQTRRFPPDTLTRWTATFFEWALTSRESR